MRTDYTGCVLVLCGAMLAAAGVEAAAQEFRIESWVYVGKEKEPVSESLTLFKAGVVYDFALPEFNETTIFDPQHARFVLLDHHRKLKTTLTTVELLDFEEELRTHPKLIKQSFLFAPKFKESYDNETLWLTLAGDQITYRAKLVEPKQVDPEVASQYRNFADWYARFNAAYKGNLHSLARPDLNRALAARGSVPEQVELTIAPQGSRKVEIRSRHLFNWKLSETDRKRIEKAGVGLADYSEVNLQKYRPVKIASGKK